MANPVIKDTQWIRESFIVNSKDLDDVDYQNRIFSSASLKFTDTLIGGSFAINPPAQFTSTADIKSPRITDPDTGTGTAIHGLGRYYSEAIDDNSQIIYMRFGVPAFNSLTTFFTGFYNSGVGQLARTGRGGGALYNLGVAAGFIVSLINWKIVAVHLLGVIYKFANGSHPSKFYYLKPTMPLYWNAVTTMVNQISVNRGIVPRVLGEDQANLGEHVEFDKSGLEHLSKMSPNLFKPGGGIDIYAMASRAQRLARNRHKAMEQALNNDNALTLDSMSQIIKSVYSEVPREGTPDFKKYLKDWFDASQSVPVSDDSSGATSSTTADKVSPSGAAQPSAPNGSPATNDNGGTSESIPTDKADLDGFAKFFTSELDDGSAFVGFRVNSTGPVNESFSNSVTESEIANKINGMSSSARSTKFDLANGNIDDSIVGKTIGGIMQGAESLMAGIADGLHVSGLASLAGAAFVDIPKHWQSSMASLPRASYTINLVSPYGNPISQLMNLYIPLTMLLAGVLPLSTGKQSYTSPFLVELYDKGRCQTRLGMVDSLSVTRGTGNLGFNNDGNVMGIDVSFSIIDMSSIMSMPIAEGFSLGKVAAAAAVGAAATATGGPLIGAGIGGAAAAALGGIFDDDNVFTDYMAVIAGMGLQDQIYTLRKLKLNLTRAMTNWDSFTSPAHMAQYAGDVWPSRLVSAFYRGTVK